MEINFRRWGVFNLVGLAGFVVQIAVISVLTRRFGWSDIAATIVALELVAVQNFLAHNYWTWRDRRAVGIRSLLARYWRYQVAKSASLAANLAITALLIHAGLPAEAANTAAVLALAIPNFLAAERLVYSTPC